jgi:YHS domain-containing protein
MMRMPMLLTVGGLLAAAALLTAGCGGDGQEDEPEPQPEGTPAAEITQKACPVMGNPINPNIYVDYEGRRVYFCCQACVAKFKADPEKYLANLDAPPAETAPETAPEGAGESAPGAAPETAPEPAPETAPEADQGMGG